MTKIKYVEQPRTQVGFQKEGLGKAHLHLALHVPGGRWSSTTYTKTEIKSHSMKSVFKSFHIQHMKMSQGYKWLYTIDIFHILRISKRKKHSSPLSYTDIVPWHTSFLHSRFIFKSITLRARARSSALKVKVQTIAHAQYPLSVCKHLLTVVVAQSLANAWQNDQMMTVTEHT